MATEIEDGWVYQLCNQCPHIERKRREDVGLFWLNGKPSCPKCGAQYARFGVNRHGAEIFDEADRGRVAQAMGRHGLWPTDSTTHIVGGAAQAKPDPAYDSPDPRDWPRTGQPLRRPPDHEPDD